MLVRIFLNDTLIINTPSIEDLNFIIEREDGYSNANQILREKIESSGLDFYGDGYELICSLRKDNACTQIDIRFEVFCDEWITIFTGIILMKEIEISLGKCIAKVKTIKDNSFSGKLSDFFTSEIPLYNTRTKNCEILNLPITVIKVPTVPTYTLTNINTFDVLDTLRYIVAFFTDNELGVESDYLTTNKYAITTGFNFYNTYGNLNQRFPTLSLSKLFLEIRKKTTLYIGVEFYANGTPYLRFEDENYFYNDTIVLDIGELSQNAFEVIDESLLYNEIAVGSNTTKVDANTSEIVVPQSILVAWNKESYIGCGGCVGLSDSRLDLVSDFIIDSNIINEALLRATPTTPSDANYSNDDAIFLLNYFVDSGVNKLVGDGLNSYNETLNNENVLNRWVGVANSCISLGRYNKYGFSIFNGLNSATDAPSNIDYLYFQDTVPCPLNQPYTYSLGCFNVSFDNQNSITTTTDLGNACSSGGLLKSYFTAQETGIYTFHSKSDIKAQVDTNLTDDFVSGDFKMRFVVYQDNTFTTEIDASPVTTVNYGQSFPIAPTVSFDIASPDFLLNSGNVVLVEISLDNIVVAAGGRQYIFHFFNSLFELTKDNTSCEDLLDNLSNFKPLITTVTKNLSLTDYQALNNNKKGVVMLEGKKTWIKKVEYTPDKLSRLVLRHKDTFC